MPMGPMIGIVVLIAIIATLLAIAGTAFWIWMIVDCARNRSLRENERVVWLLVIVFTHLLGALIYYFAGRIPTGRRVQYTYQPGMEQQRRYEPYQQGYQPQQVPPQTYQEKGQQEGRAEQPQYEQPQTSYPEIPQ